MRELGVYLQQNYCWPEGTCNRDDQVLASDVVSGKESARPEVVFNVMPTKWDVQLLRDVCTFVAIYLSNSDHIATQTPCQRNGNDCGIYMLFFILQLARGYTLNSPSVPVELKVPIAAPDINGHRFFLVEWIMANLELDLYMK